MINKTLQKQLKQLESHKLTPQESQELAEKLKTIFKEKYDEKYEKYQQTDIENFNEFEKAYDIQIAYYDIYLSVFPYCMCRRRSRKMNYELYCAIKGAERMGLFE